MPNNRLLLIEDDYDVAEMLLMYFTSQGFDVIHADTGIKGIDLARTKFPNLILLDVMLPYMDGYDVCIQLRQAALTKYIPILFLTQKDERAAKVRGLELGADDYITKPFDIDELRLRVQGAIRRAARENLHEPRTGLPTGQLVEEELINRAPQQSTVRFMLHHFDAYSEVYGFVAGNQIMAHTAQIIQQAVAENGSERDFIGIYEDQFVVLTFSPDPQALTEHILQRFANEVPTFYSFIDVEQGGISVEDGEGLVPIMSLEAALEAGEHQGY
jgi:DNA-binding response OmpR family regulator